MAAGRSRRLKFRVIVPVILLIMIGLGVWQWMTPARDFPARADAETERITAGGRVIGFSEENGSQAWLGIPYASPPIGPLRWRAPRPVRPHSGTFTALKAGPFCTQLGNRSIATDSDSMGKPVGSEDCLYLNIWAPAHTAADIEKKSIRRPVMFWIHGGGNSIGEGANYTGRHLAADHNVVVVTINYRLGPMGWFSHQALRASSATAADGSGNYGTLDMIAALQWVHVNIAAFGGDPDKVTLFGESAGAFDTVSLLLAPGAKGLFQRAIVQSGGLRLDTVERAENYRDAPVAGHAFSSREVINRLLIADGKAETRDEARAIQDTLSAGDLENYLRSKQAGEIFSVYEESALGMIRFPNLIQDGAVLPMGNPAELLGDLYGNNPVPVMIGSNRDEFKLFMAFNPQFTDSYLKFIFQVKDRMAYAATARYLSDAWKATGVDRVADLLSQSAASRVFAYRFDWDEEPDGIGTELPFLLGAAHMLEVPFVFKDTGIIPGLDRLFTSSNEEGRRSLSNSMASYWTAFADSGDPGKGQAHQQPEWKPWRPDDRQYLMLDSPADSGIRMSKQTVSMQNLKSRLLSETSDLSRDTLCGLYVTLFGSPAQFYSDTSLWDDHEFLNLGREGCTGFSMDAGKGI